MHRYAVVRSADGYTENVIVAEADFEVSKDHLLVESDTANPGDTWDGSRFISPPPRELSTEEIDARTIEAKASPTHTELVRLLRFKGVIREVTDASTS